MINRIQKAPMALLGKKTNSNFIVCVGRQIVTMVWIQAEKVRLPTIW